MRKMKKFAALALAGALVLGMSTTAMAAPSATNITVENAENATLSYVQVIEPSAKKATGWDFTDAAYAEDYKTAFGITDDPASDLDEQKAIAMLIKSDSTLTVPSTAPSIIRNTAGATATQVNQALDNVINGATMTGMAKPQSVTEAGVYVVKATEAGYTYEPMAAYVGFGAYTNGIPTVLTCESLTAKKIETKVTKADNDDNNAVAISQKVTYTVTTAFPYFNQNDTNKVFKISDAIDGAEYVGLVDDVATADVNEKTATITIGDLTVTDVEFVQNGDTFTVDLSKYIDNANSNARKTVTVTYQAVVTETDVTNTASSHIGDVETKSVPVNLYTGQITLTKVDAADENMKLANAGFEVSLDGKVLTFVQNDEDVAVYTYDPAGTITEVLTDANGNVVVEGLDVGTYTFTEITAPEGYSVNETPLAIELDITEEEDGNAVAIFTAADTMADTKLIALPSTGGMGTTIFTIGGVAIIIAAAGLLMARRRVAR